MTSNNTACHAWRNTLMRFSVAALALSLPGGCASMLPAPPLADSVYLLESSMDLSAPAASAPADARSEPPKRDLVLEVSLPRARAGYGTTDMLWVQQPHELKAYSRNRWANTPARMLAPLIAQALEHSGGFQSVLQAPSSASAMLRLDTELIRLQQDFSVRPSRVQFALSAQLIDLRTRRVIASAEFEEAEDAESEDAYGGVRAANRALDRLLARLSAFCVKHLPPS